MSSNPVHCEVYTIQHHVIYYIYILICDNIFHIPCIIFQNLINARIFCEQLSFFLFNYTDPQTYVSYFEGKILKESPISYSMFVRAWYNEDTYADFKTNGLLVLSTPLAKRKIKGTAVSILLLKGIWRAYNVINIFNQ